MLVMFYLVDALGQYQFDCVVCLLRFPRPKKDANAHQGDASMYLCHLYAYIYCNYFLSESDLQILQIPMYNCDCLSSCMVRLSLYISINVYVIVMCMHVLSI